MSDEPLRLQLVTGGGPATEPITVADAKAHCRIDETVDDNLVDGLIATARGLAEKYMRRAIMTQTWKQYLDCWPACGFLEMPRAPLQQVTSIKTYDDSDVATVFDSVYYFVDTATRPGRITIRTTGNWPTPTRVANGIEITFKCGYADAPKDVPQEIKQGVLQLIAWLYEHRGDENMDPPDAVYAPLDGERTWLL